MRKTTVFLGVLLVSQWTLVSACSKNREKKPKDRQGAVVVQKTKNSAVAPGAGKTAPPRAGDNVPQGEVVDGTGPQIQVLSLKSPIHDKSYDLTVTGPKNIQQGQPAVFSLTLVPKTPYHTNKLFPFEISFDKTPPGVKLDKGRYTKKDAALFTPKKAVFKVTVTVTGNLPARISGLYKFSVCTPKFCETPKVKVLLTVGKTGAKAGSGAASAPAREHASRAGKTPARK